MKYTLAISAAAHVLFLGAIIVPAYQGGGMDSAQIINVSLIGGGAPSAKPGTQVVAPAKQEPESQSSSQSKMAYKAPKKEKKAKPAAEKSPAKAASGQKSSGTGSSGAGSPGGKGSGVGGGNITLDDEDFRFAYYLEVLRERIGYNWSPPALFGAPSEVVATVYFKIARDGTISDEKVEKTSNREIFDRAAVRAVSLSDPLPPLPAGFKGKWLGVHFEFQHNPG